jgi:hypothetical protein
MVDHADTRDRDTLDAAASHAVRLSPREWAVALALVAPVLLLLPRLWARWEVFEPAADYRVPNTSSEDYWHIERRLSHAVRDGRIVVLGDSVMWGRYVAAAETLSARLTARGGGVRFANAAVNGLHPAAFAGLVRYFGAPLRGARVVVHFNPLWLTSPRRDLTAEKEFPFNHPALVPQFVPRVPCYRAPWSERLDAVVLRSVSFAAWASHLRIACFEGTGIPTWTLRHPYANPLRQLTFRPGAGPTRVEEDDRPWTARGIARQDFPWVPLRSSLQWRLFREGLAGLRARDARVFVLVGPFNEHLIGRDSLARYRARKHGVVAWLSGHGLAHCAPPPLPSGSYADASHPTADGYAELARVLFDTPAFRRFSRGTD